MSHLIVLSMLSSAAAVSTLMRFGCDGGLDFGEKLLGGPASIRFNGFAKLANFYDSYIDEAAKDPTCGCPELSSDQLNMFFKTYSPKFLFNLAKGFDAAKLGPLANCGGLRSSNTSTFPKIDLPSSCNAERWNAGQGCQAAIKRTEGDLKVVVRMEKCAGREFPFFEVKCEGKDCDTIFTPCTADNECSDGTNFSCLEFANTADQCAQETCGEHGRTSLTMVPTSKCVAGAHNPETQNGCSLNGATFGAGFSYYYDSADESRTKVPKSAGDISSCVRKMCSGGQWSPPTPAGKSECFQALVVRKAATGAQCTSAGETVANPNYPFTSQNTCNWDEIKDAKEYGLSQAVTPFGVGSTRYISNANDILGQFFGYDAVDFAKDPFGCRKSGDAVRTLVQLARKITDRHAGRPERMLANNVVGVCVPGQGYTLEAVPSNSGFTRYSVRGPMEDPKTTLNKLFGLNCDVQCADANAGTSCTASCGKDTFAYTGAAYTDADKFDGASARKVRPVTAVTAGATVLAHFDCSASLAILPNNPLLGIEGSVSGVLEFLFGFRNEHRAAYKCRATAHGGAELSNDQYDIRSFTLSNPLFFMTKPLSEKLTNIGVNFKDLRTRLLSTGNGRLAIPKSCSFDNWLEQGQCRLTFTGLGNAELFGEQTDLNAYLSVCPGSFLPEAYLECVGAGCKAFNGPISCAANSDCGIAGFRCNKFADLFKRESNSGSGGESGFGTSSSPVAVSQPLSSYTAWISKESLNSGAFVFVTSVDISGADLKVSASIANGVTNGVDVLVAKGPYTGMFASVTYLTQYDGDEAATCDPESVTGTISYKSDGIYVSTKCTCTFGKKRTVTVPRNLPLGTSIKQALSKRQSSDPSDGENGESSVSIVSVALALSGNFRPDKSQCNSIAQDKLVPKIINFFAGAASQPNHDGICFVDSSKRDAQGRLAFEVWGNDQVQIDGSDITLRYLKSWLEGSSVQPIDDGKSLTDKFGKDAEWFEKTGRFCIACPEGVNKDGNTKDSASSFALAVAAIVVAICANL